MKPNKVEDHILEKIRKYNMMDIELYQCSQGLFEKQVERMGPKFKSVVKEFDQIIADTFKSRTIVEE